jgi:hypothetical protein
MKKLISFTLFAAILLIAVIAQKTRVKDAPEADAKTVAALRTENSL